VINLPTGDAWPIDTRHAHCRIIMAGSHLLWSMLLATTALSRCMLFNVLEPRYVVEIRTTE